MRTLLLPLAAALAVAALPAQSPLTTTFAGGNAQSGNMFDVGALVPVVVTGFDIHLTGIANIEVYTLTNTNTPYLPSVNTAANWTLVGSATGVVGAGAGVPTPVPIVLSVPIAANEIQAFYVTTTAGTLAYTNGTTTGALFASNNELQFFEGSGVAYPFTANFNPRIFNGNIYYNVVGSGFATKSLYGAGCYNEPRMVSEFWTPNSTIDLVGTSWTWIYQPSSAGGNYIIVPSGQPYDAATAAANGINLVLTAPTSSSSANWDDASSVQTLPFAFPYPNAASASVTDITINSNGRIYLGASFDTTFAGNGANSGQTPGIFAGTLGPALPVIAAFMNDIDPEPTSGGGSLWYEAASPNGGVRITWDSIPNWQDPVGPTAVLNSMQLELLPNGTIFLSYGASLGNSGSAANDAIVGFSAGGGEPELRVDWSTLNGFVTGEGLVALTINSNASPRFGTTITVTVNNIPAGSIGGIIYGFTKLDPGTPLFPILGVACDLYATLDIVQAGLPVAGSFTSTLAIPNDPTLQGFTLAAQGFALNAPVANSLGAMLSNGLELVLGN